MAKDIQTETETAVPKGNGSVNWATAATGAAGTVVAVAAVITATVNILNGIDQLKARSKKNRRVGFGKEN
jgi:hypothetical protein